MTPEVFSVPKLLAGLTSGDLSSRSLTEECLKRIDQLNPRINAFISVQPEQALTKADEIDRRRAGGEQIGLLQGLPIAVKDNICTAGSATTCGSRMLKKFVPPYDATVVTRITEADGIILGKTNLDEFAMGSSTETSAFGVTRNPHNTDCVPGGSSGGSAAAVASGMVPLSLGSDTGGSIRQPASFCGVVGLKPTYGRVSRYGLVAYASSLDQIGPMAPDTAGAALLLQAIAGHDQHDSTSANTAVPAYSDDTPSAEGLRIGVVEEHFAEGLDPEISSVVRSAIDRLKDAGAVVKSVRLPHSAFAVAAYYLIAPSEASSNLARYDGIHYGYRTEEASDLTDVYSSSRSEAFGAEVKRRIMLGTYALSAGYYDAYYLRAMKVRRKIRQDFDAAFKEVDLIAGPVAPTTAYPVGQKLDDPLRMYLEDIYTISANLAGLPGISVPCGASDKGLPIGLQLLGPHFGEPVLLQTARVVESQRA